MNENLQAGGWKMPQNFPRSTWKTEYEKSNKIWIITDDNKLKYSSNRKDILKSTKKLWETLYQVNFHSCYYWVCLQNS